MHIFLPNLILYLGPLKTSFQGDLETHCLNTESELQFEVKEFKKSSSRAKEVSDWSVYRNKAISTSTELNSSP